MTIRPLVDLLDVTRRRETSPTVSEQILIRVSYLKMILLTATNPYMFLCLDFFSMQKEIQFPNVVFIVASFSSFKNQETCSAAEGERALLI